MNKWLLSCVPSKSAPHAGAKAPEDVRVILSELGYRTVNLQQYTGFPGVKKELQSFGENRGLLRATLSQMDRGDILLVQSPLSLAVFLGSGAGSFLKKIKKKGVSCVVLLHDVQFLRRNVRAAFQRAESMVLSMADVFIVHSPAMGKALAERGYPWDKMVSLTLFDYLSRGKLTLKEGRHSRLLIAGNLSREKSGYLYDPALEKASIPFVLWGKGFEEPHFQYLHYEGIFLPDEIPGNLQVDFGLVWDGDSAETCSGRYGEYLLYNSPHKASLYLAMGLPLVVWEKSALASFVQKEKIGFTVSTLTELGDRLKSVSEEEYAHMAHRAFEMGCVLRKGQFTAAAVKKAEAILSS